MQRGRTGGDFLELERIRAHLNLPPTTTHLLVLYLRNTPLTFQLSHFPQLYWY